MTLSFGRLRSPSEALGAKRVLTVAGGPAAPRDRTPGVATVVRKQVVDAALCAERLIEQARVRAKELEEEAGLRLHTLREEALQNARAQAATELSAQVLSLAALEQRIDERAIDRLVELSRLLAERLLGEALALDPTRVAALARRALDEARGARRIEILAHPDDVPLLERTLSEGELSHVTRIVQSPERARGNLRLNTEIGTLDADLSPQLERLARRLRETLVHER